MNDKKEYTKIIQYTLFHNSANPAVWWNISPEISELEINANDTAAMKFPYRGNKSSIFPNDNE